jgi:hypothetical protein
VKHRKDVLDGGLETTREFTEWLIADVEELLKAVATAHYQGPDYSCPCPYCAQARNVEKLQKGAGR